MDAHRKRKQAYWDRRLNRPSALVAPTPADLAVELNRRLQEDPACSPRVRFLLSTSASGTSVLTWQGPAHARPLIGRIVQALSNDVELPVPFQMVPVDADDGVE